MNIDFYMPVKIFSGEGCVSANQNLFDIGKKALIVTDAESAVISGALEDVSSALDSLGIGFTVFNKIRENPLILTCFEGGTTARNICADFIIGIGGGSSMDAAKAIAAYASNPDIKPEEIFESGLKPSLPLILIPTTAGTGSEVTPYSILTIPAAETKRSFSVPELFPKIAFLDRRYTERLPVSITRDTAVDALSHLVEGYLSRRAIGTSDIFAERGIRLWAQCITALREGEFSPEDRDRLLVASTLGGITISHTGTTFVHSLGYSLTYYHDIPHGRANGMLMGEYLRYTQEYAPQRVSNVLSWLGLADISEFAAIVKELSGSVVELTDQEIKAYAAKAMGSRNVGYSQGEVTEAVLQKVLRNS